MNTSRFTLVREEPKRTDINVGEERGEKEEEEEEEEPRGRVAGREVRGVCREEERHRGEDKEDVDRGAVTVMNWDRLLRLFGSLRSIEALLRAAHSDASMRVSG